MADFKYDKKGMASLEKQLQEQFGRAEREANQAAAQHSTPEGKARAFARVLRKHGVEKVDEAQLRKQFGG